MFLMSTLTEMSATLVLMVIVGYYGYWVSEVSGAIISRTSEVRASIMLLLVITENQGVQDWGASKTDEEGASQTFTLLEFKKKLKKSKCVKYWYKNKLFLNMAASMFQQRDPTTLGRQVRLKHKFLNKFSGSSPSPPAAVMFSVARRSSQKFLKTRPSGFELKHKDGQE
jgi:hypothetical protein